MIAAVDHADVREIAAYSYAEVSRALHIPASTLRAWTQGQEYEYRGDRREFRPVLINTPPDGLTYNNVVEAYVLRALRTVHNLSLGQVRQAQQTAKERYGINRLFIHEQLRIAPGEMFLDEYTSLVSLSHGEQLAMGKILQAYLERVEYDDDKLATLFYPLTRGPKATNSPKLIALNPKVSFGKPIIKSRGIRTSVVVDRIDAGEEPEHVAADFGLTMDEVDEAVFFELAA